MSNHQTNPDKILEIGLSFWRSKVLLSAVELGVFAELAKGAKNADELCQCLELHPRGAKEFLDALVALELLQRDNGKYRNTPETDQFLDPQKSGYIGSFLEMVNQRLYPFWGSLTEALLTGEPQNESSGSDEFFAELYQDSQRLRLFLSAMTGISLTSARAIAKQFPWQNYQTFVDIGTAQGALPVQLALTHSHLTGAGLDLPVVQPIFEEYVAAFELEQRLQFHAADFFKDPFPAAEVFVMGHILHDWSLEEKRFLVSQAYEALSSGGALIVYGSIIDDERRHNAFGLLMSLNMLIETPGGFDYTGADCQKWMQEVGFRETYVESLSETESMIVGFK